MRMSPERRHEDASDLATREAHDPIEVVVPTSEFDGL